MDRTRGAAMVVPLALAAAVLGAVAPAAPVGAGEPAAGTVRGTVTAEDTGFPLQGACVVFVRSTDRGYLQLGSVQAGANGSYEASVPVGSAVVVFEPGVGAGYGCYPHPPLGGSTVTAVEWHAGGRGADEVYGDRGDDEVRGGRGDDLLYGGDGRWGDGDGDDLIAGGAGADHLVGGDGTDDCRGGLGFPDTAGYYETLSGIP